METTLERRRKTALALLDSLRTNALALLEEIDHLGNVENAAGDNASVSEEVAEARNDVADVVTCLDSTVKDWVRARNEWIEADELGMDHFEFKVVP